MCLWDFSQFLLQILGLSQYSQLCHIPRSSAWQVELGKQQQDLDILSEMVLYCHLKQKFLFGVGGQVGMQKELGLAGMMKEAKEWAPLIYFSLVVCLKYSAVNQGVSSLVSASS